jgi:hypothetical protein
MNPDIPKNESRKSNTKANTRMVSSNVHYNADTTCVTGSFLYDMCNTSMDSDIQIVYV